jgi:hypothetical protein
MRILDRMLTAIARRAATPAAERVRDDARCSPATKVALRQLWLDHARRAERGERVADLAATGFRVFSQFEEDGIVLCLLASLGAGPRIFVDIGAGDGNCANLAVNFGFHGVFVEANAALVARGRTFYAEHPDTSLYPPAFVEARVTPANADSVVRSAGIAGEIDLLSIDIDGNDYWVWEALTVVEPRVVLVEAHPELGRRSLVAPYADDPANIPGRPRHFLGASPAALTVLAERRGYRLVAANRFGFNLFYVRRDVGRALFPTLPVEELFRHPRARARELPADALAGLPFVEP